MQTESEVIGMEQIVIEIYGRVQGVGFRSFVSSKAKALEVNGYVMNRPDGSVYVLAQGDRKKLEELLRKVQKGPALAKVDGVSFQWQEPKHQYKKFVIALESGTLNDQTHSFVNLGKRLLGLQNKVPKHIAVIPDGNRRWARQNGRGLMEGHEKSASFENLIPLIEESKKLGIRYVTFWAFSTENWRRPRQEVKFLLDLTEKFADRFRQYSHEQKIRFRHIGRKDRLPKKVVKHIVQAEEETEEYDRLFVQMCLDYGGRDELVRAVNKLLKKGVQEINEDDLMRSLDSSGIPDPDLIIRTSGEQRTSGFMSFQSAYSEFYFTNVHYPDFGPQELRKAVNEYANRRRKFGK